MAGRFKLKDTNYFLLPSNPHMLHLATINYGLREFVVMLCIRGPKAQQTYIEEVVLNSVDFSNDVYANFKFVDDENLAQDLAAFAQMHGVIDMKRIADVLFDTHQTHLLPT